MTANENAYDLKIGSEKGRAVSPVFWGEARRNDGNRHRGGGEACCPILTGCQRNLWRELTAKKVPVENHFLVRD